MTRVAIIGGGIGGLLAARALCRRGIEVAIYEAAPELREIGAGVALGPNAMKVLRSLGLEDEVRAVAGRWDWAVTRNWKTGRPISKTSRDQQASPVRQRGRDRSSCGPARRARTLAAGRHRLARRAMHRGTAGRSGRGGEIPGRQRDRGRHHHRRRRDPLGRRARHCSVRTHPRFTGKICYRSVVPVDAVPGEPPPSENVHWLGPHGTIVAVPGAARRADQRRLPLRRRGLPARVLGVRVRAQRGARALQRLARVVAADLLARGRSGTSGRSTTGTRSRNGRVVA